VPLALRAVLVLAVLPFATGRLIVTYGDTLFHLPTRAVIADELRAGRLPLVHPGASCGQPLAGHPHYGVFFPDTLLAPLLPLSAAYGLRFALSLVLGFVGARRWARAEGASREAAEIAALAFVLSGVFLSAWRFFSSGLALALAPAVLAAAAKIAARSGDPWRLRRAAAELGLWAGLEVLAGEPVIALLAFALAGARLVPGGLRAIGGGVAGFCLAALVAAPQIAATAQILGESTREEMGISFAAATRTSVHPVRLVEQVLPFPYGRPDRRDADGFAGHPSFESGTPYLWTLHLGLPVLGLVLLHARGRGQAVYAAAAVFAAGLSLGRHLAGAAALYPLLSLGGRLRFPVKWWYVVALMMVPLAAHAADRWLAGERAPSARRLLLAAWCVVALVVVFTRGPVWPLAAGPLLSIAATLALFTARRHGPALAAALAVSLVACGAPLLLAVLDAPPPAPPRIVTGRLFTRLRTDAHPLPPRADARPVLTRDFFRRATPELWPLTAARIGAGYAFDFDPDGSYAAGDRALHKEIDSRDWPERAPLLRAAGVTAVVSDSALPAPYRPMAVLNADEGVRLYGLEGAAPAVRAATRVHRASDLSAVAAAHGDPSFDPLTDVVLDGPDARPRHPAASAAVVIASESPARLSADVDASADAVVVWNRTFYRAWRATVDGRSVATVRADGHLVGVPVPAGRHEVQIAWDARPVTAGLGLGLLGLALLAAAYRRD
jgi:hypothetical protein